MNWILQIFGKSKATIEAVKGLLIASLSTSHKQKGFKADKKDKSFLEIVWTKYKTI